MKRFIILIIVAVLVGGAIGGAFIGGVAIGKDQGKEEAAQNLQNRIGQFQSGGGQFINPGGSSGSTFNPPDGERAFIGRGGTIGTIEKIEGNIITLKAMNGTSVNVITGDETSIQKMVDGSLADLKTGDNVTVSGTTNDDGTVQATGIVMTPIMTIQQP
jgi:hypothetical protein